MSELVGKMMLEKESIDLKLVAHYFGKGIIIDHSVMKKGDMNRGDNNADAELFVLVLPLFLGCFKQMCIHSKANQQERDAIPCKCILVNDGLTMVTVKKH